MTLLLIHTSNYSILLLALGLFIRYLIGRRRFNRRSIAGMQAFSSYLKGLVITIIETLLNIAGAVLIIIGLIALIPKL